MRERDAAVVRGPWPDADEGDAGLFETLVPDDRYLVAFVRATRAKRWERLVWDCTFRIIDGAHAGRLLPRFLTVPEPPRRKRPSLRSSLALDFRRITGRRVPRDLHRLRPDDLYGGATLEAVTVTVHRDSQGEKVPETARYSRIDRIVGVVDGTVHHLRRGLK